MNCLYVDFCSAPQAERANYAYSRRTREALYAGFREAGGCVVLVTCNRTEVYFSCSRTRAEEIIRRAALPPARFYMGAEEHLFSLAAGLCSMLAGEDEILGQLRAAYEEARAAGATKGLDEAFQIALACGKAVRTRTRISSFACSVATLAANEAARFLPRGGAVLVVGGTGKFGGALLKNLAAHKNLTVYAAERTHGVAASVRGDVLPVAYRERYTFLERADVVIGTTASPHVVFEAEKVERVVQKCPRERLFIDLAMPPDIGAGVGELAGCRLLGIDGFARRARENNQKKQEAIKKARAVVEEYLVLLAVHRAARRYLSSCGALPKALRLLKKHDPSAFLRAVGEGAGE